MANSNQFSSTCKKAEVGINRSLKFSDWKGKTNFEGQKIVNNNQFTYSSKFKKFSEKKYGRNQIGNISKTNAKEVPDDESACSVFLRSSTFLYFKSSNRYKKWSNWSIYELIGVEKENFSGKIDLWTRNWSPIEEFKQGKDRWWWLGKRVT